MGFRSALHSQAKTTRYRYYALAVYLMARAGEVKALDWADVDLVRGVVHIHASVNRETGETTTTKSGESRRLPLEKELLPLLTAMHKTAKGKGLVLGLDGTETHLARQLRYHLEVAGITRAELLHDDANRQAMTFHGLRATGVTWAAARGDDSLRIKQRAGHKSFSTTEIYIREAENLSDAFGVVFPSLPESLNVAPEYRQRFRSILTGADDKTTTKQAQLVEAPGIEAEPGASRDVAKRRETLRTRR